MEKSREHQVIAFYVNGKEVTVEARKIDPRTVLGEYLRDQLGLKGLQMFCRQGGCGSCTVVLSPASAAAKTAAAGVVDVNLHHRTVNACLVPLCSVDGLHVTTVEALGSVKTGLSPLQKALVKHNGTQCGFCSPGMVMSMYGLLLNKQTPSSQDVEDQIDGNLCRCTGYRPILDAFQSFACPNRKLCSPNQIVNCPNMDTDIEDICINGSCKGAIGKHCFLKGETAWIKVLSLKELYNVLKSYRNQKSVRMIRGNTSTGIYPEFSCDIFIDISQVSDLLGTSATSKGITIGGAVSISNFMMLLDANKSLSSSFSPMLSHLRRVATPQVRNNGSIAGNLMLAHDHPDFASDITTLLIAAEARLKICHAFSDGMPEVVTVEKFLDMDMDGKVITEIYVPTMPSTSHFVRHKVALIRVNAHPIVNAAFKFEINSDTDIISSSIIVYGGMKFHSQRAWQTEKALVGKSYKDPKMFKECLDILSREMAPDPLFGRTKYRELLMKTLFYKSVLFLWPDNSLPSRLSTVVTDKMRPISYGSVSFDEGDPSEYPVSLPLPKLSAAAQVTGEVEYLDDLKIGDTLHAVFVRSTVANAEIKAIDPSEALAIKGVMAFLSAETVTADGYCNLVSDYEFVFAPKRIDYYGQALGLIVAKTKRIADAAAKLVKVTYANLVQPILTIEDAIKSNSFFDTRSFDFEKGNVDDYLMKSKVVIEGQATVGHQFHFHLETQRSLCIPGEEGFMNVYTSTQNPSQVQQCVSTGLNVPQHKVNVIVKHVGGGFGAKLNRTAPIAMACAMAADKLQRPVRLILDLSTNMQAVGGRSPYFCKYKVAAECSGQIHAIYIQVFNNQGAHFDFENPYLTVLTSFIDGVYNIANWKIEGKIAKTNLPACTYMRGPVFVEMTLMIETILDHVAYVLQLRPEKVREINMYKKGDSLLCGQKLTYCNAKDVFHAVKDSSDYEARVKEIQAFNDNSQWVKKGISLVPIKFVAPWEALQMICLINIHPDCSISIYHSGCEIGQGLDVKVAQVAAMSLGSLIEGYIDMKDIHVHSTTTIVANNVAESGGSVTSELCAKSVMEACEVLIKRLRTLSNMLSSKEGKPTWAQLIEKALYDGVDLQARGRIYPAESQNGPYQYVSFGAGVTEVEVDILTGETHVLRADVILDCGKSLNPAVDIGQVQGAFVQGLGYHLSEEYIYDTKTGKLITDGTWEYKPPSSKDIPVIFNAALLPNSSNPYGLLRSKFSGEPPYGIACSAILAVHQAISAAKLEWGNNSWFPIASPATVEQVSQDADIPMSMLNIIGL